MERWDAEDVDRIVVGRRMRTGRRRPVRPARRIVTIAAGVLVAGVGIGAFFWFSRPTGLDTLPNPAVVAPGGSQAILGDGTITVGLEVRNTADRPVTLTAARIVPPTGLTLVTLTIVAPGEGNQGFALDGDLPPLAPVELGINATDRNAIVAARFTVDCAGLPPPDAATPEQIFVTIQLGDLSRVDELTPPVVEDLPWLTGSARRLCDDPVPTESADPPLPPLPDPTPTPGAAASPDAGPGGG